MGFQKNFFRKKTAKKPIVKISFSAVEKIRPRRRWAVWAVMEPFNV
jgi:hypothetical protein